MKIKITRPDGTVIEAEGTAEECARMLAAPPVYFVPTPTWIAPQPGPFWYEPPQFSYTSLPNTGASTYLWWNGETVTEVKPASASSTLTVRS